jgi:hypothetical protein
VVPSPPRPVVYSPPGGDTSVTDHHTPHFISSTWDPFPRPTSISCYYLLNPHSSSGIHSSHYPHQPTVFIYQPLMLQPNTYQRIHILHISFKPRYSQSIHTTYTIVIFSPTHTLLIAEPRRASQTVSLTTPALHISANLHKKFDKLTLKLISH